MTATDGPDAALVGRRLRRLAAGLAVGHVALMVTGVLMQHTPSLSEGEDGIRVSYAGGDLTRIFTGGYLELLGFTLLLPVVVLLAGTLGQRTDLGRWASASAGAFGAGYVAMTIGSGFAPGAAAVWGTHHGLDLTTALVVNDVRNVAFFLSLALLGAHAIGTGIAALSDGWATRSIGWGGLLTGAVLLGSVPLAGHGLADLATLVWVFWWLTLAVELARREPTATTAAADPLAALARR